MYYKLSPFFFFILLFIAGCAENNLSPGRLPSTVPETAADLPDYYFNRKGQWSMPNAAHGSFGCVMDDTYSYKLPAGISKAIHIRSSRDGGLWTGLNEEFELNLSNCVGKKLKFFINTPVQIIVKTETKEGNEVLGFSQQFISATGGTWVEKSFSISSFLSGMDDYDPTKVASLVFTDWAMIKSGPYNWYLADIRIE
ncbi:MAG TPA: hypothetical protein VKS21_09475 [Spirochaetota bacterium]|nr:hypothetical protein [Spirochaetota bacterium]